VTLPYATADAMRKAIIEKAKHRVASDPSVSVDKRLRQFAYSRLLARVFSAESTDWVLKGGIALLARLPDARHSRDIDLARRGASNEQLVEEIESLLAIDLGDFFEFRTGRPVRPLTGQHSGMTIPVVAYLGAKELARFNLDVVSSANTTAALEIITPLRPIDVDGLPEVPWRAYPLVDHLADKFSAIVETHGPEGRTSSRYRDLVDIALIATSQHFQARALRIAIQSELRFRGLSVREFALADPAAWRAGYGALQREIPRLTVAFDSANEIAGRLFAVIGSDVDATWDPLTTRWI
jgi:hypothetical protein